MTDAQARWVQRLAGCTLNTHGERRFAAELQAWAESERGPRRDPPRALSPGQARWFGLILLKYRPQLGLKPRGVSARRPKTFEQQRLERWFAARRVERMP